MTTEEASMTTLEKFDQLIKDFSAHMDAAKVLSARMKVLQKEVAKSPKGKKRKKRTDESELDTPKKPSALQKPLCISNELCKFLGFPENSEHSRQEVTMTINKFIKDNDLQDPSNRRYIKLEGSDAALNLKKLLRDPDQPVTFFSIQRYLKPHYPPKGETKVEPKVEPKVEAPEAVPDSAMVEEAVPKEPPKKQKRVVRRAS